MDNFFDKNRRLDENYRLGIDEARDWFQQMNFRDFQLSGLDNTLFDGAATTKLGASALQALLRVETKESLMSARSKDAMYSLHEWKDSDKEARKILLMVPLDLYGLAKNTLYLYDEFLFYLPHVS